MSTTLNKNWIELSTAPYPYSNDAKTKLTYVKLKSIDRLSSIEGKDEEGEEQWSIIALAQGTKYLYKTEKTYAEAEQTARDLIATVENPDSQANKPQKHQLQLVSSGKDQ